MATALQRISESTRDVLLGISTYLNPVKPGDLQLDDAFVERMRDVWGGNLTPPVQVQTRWYLRDVEAAERAANMGDLSRAAQLMLSAKGDGHLLGVLSTRTDGLVRLPKVFKGDADIIASLEPGRDGARALFDEIFPPSELALLGQDGVLLGVGVGELLPVKGRDYPVLVRLEPQYLQYEWTTNRWYYHSTAGRLAITPGDGRWVLHTPGGRVAPWANALWRAVGIAWVRKSHAQLHKDNWEAKLANPARVATAPQGAAEEQKQTVFQNLMAWGINTVFGLTPGYDVKLLESNGRGHESFNKTIDESNTEFVMAIAGQKVTTDGGAGFANADIHKSIRADLIQATADGLAYTINTQGLPAVVAQRYGEQAVLTRPVAVAWDVTPPKDRNAEALSMVTFGDALSRMQTGIAATAREGTDIAVNTRLLAERFNIPLTVTVAEPDAPEVELGGGGGATTVQDTALNGAQITSLVGIVTAVAAGALPRDAAIAILQRAFLVDAAQAEALLGSAGQTFTIAAAPAPAAPAQLPEAAE